MYGQLGHGNTDKQSSPKMVEALTEHTIYLLACGNFHTVGKPMLIAMGDHDTCTEHGEMVLSC